MKIKHIIYLLILTGTGVQAQDKYGRPSPVAGINELKIGDKVPDILIDKIINDDKRSIRTSEYKDKLLVLDFWDTSCTVCIASMPKLDSLQGVFGNQIKLLSVTWQAEDLITKFMKTNRYLNNRKIPVHRPTVVEDRKLRTYFRYETNPHVVWINKGKVVAITGGEYITGKNIQTVLDGKAVDWPLKTEFFDTTTPFVALSPLWQDASDSPFYNYSVLTGQATSVRGAGINFKQDTVHNQTRIALFNQEIYQTYKMLLYNAMPGLVDFAPHPPARTVLEVSDPTRYKYKKEYGEYADWTKKNVICYEVVKKGLVEKSAMAKLAVQDLNNRLGINGRYEKRKVKCMVFVKTGKPVTDTLANDDKGGTLVNVIVLNLDMTGIYPPFIDETGFTGGLNLQKTDGTIDGLRKEMQRHNLDLIEAEREIEVLVISDKKDI